MRRLAVPRRALSAIPIVLTAVALACRGTAVFGWPLPQRLTKPQVSHGPKSEKAVAAIRKHDEAVTKARQAYLRATADADRDELADLKDAQAAVMKGGDPDEADRIQAVIDGLEAPARAGGRSGTQSAAELVIRRAGVGVGQNGVDVTDFLRDKVKDGGLCRPFAGIPDPQPGAHKTLVVEAAYGGRTGGPGSSGRGNTTGAETGRSSKTRIDGRIRAAPCFPELLGGSCALGGCEGLWKALFLSPPRTPSAGR